MKCPLLQHTVTLYPKSGGRKVVTGCYLEYSDRADYDETGRQVRRGFLLIAPADCSIGVDDLVFDGVGPERVGCVADTPGLLQVGYAQPVYAWGKLHHWEAGQKSNFFGG